MAVHTDALVYLIVGGTSGIGLSAARALVERGDKVMLVGDRPDDIEPAQALLGDNAAVMLADARDPETAVRAIRETQSRFGSIYGLYHVAGGSGRQFGDGPLHECSLEGWQKTLELNLTSLMLSNQAIIRHWLQQRQGGSIVNLSSVLAFAPSPTYFATHAYAAAKAAIVGFSKSIAAYYADRQIRVNVLAPGLIETPMSARAAGDPAIASFIRQKQPLHGGGMGRPDDLVAAALYFLSPASSFTTGQVLSVDGGWCLSDAAPEL